MVQQSQATTDVTSLLQAWSAGDRSAQEKLWPVVFAELKRLARRHLAHERPDHTLQSAALVNEAYLRMVDWKNSGWQNRAQFFAMCARMMRQILVDHARTRNRLKRSGGKISLDDIVLVSESRSEQLLALDEALNRLSKIHPRKGDVVELRFFAGLSVEEIGEVLKVSRLTVIRDWTFARAWLRTAMSGEIDEDGTMEPD
jgi:RNA polymerase sigma factor (TIGR02999 family)